ncbi:hypothetical protein [Sulfitobacter mediterraneus]|uniref:hypothetical protein n=1 Tax=Sulfitobacter mediterraneus TaxID=83219 RepID=UPI000EA2B026|nr:hypothetical protein [Sulfitobacter mediterraneus]
MDIQRADVLSKVGRDIVIFWFLGFVLLSFHLKAHSAHNERLWTAGAFNTFSIARALATTSPEDAITQETLQTWYQAFGKIASPDQPLPEGFGLGPLDIAFIVTVKPFGISGTCDVLVRSVEARPDGETIFMIHPAFDCLFHSGYSVYPTRLVFKTGEDGLGYAQDVYFSQIWEQAFARLINAFQMSSWCDVQGHCLEGQYEPVEFAVTPQPYFTDERIANEFLLPINLLPNGTVSELIRAGSSQGELMTDEVYANALREAERRHPWPGEGSNEDFFGFAVPMPYLPFMGILLATYLCGTVLTRALLLTLPLKGTGMGEVLGPAPWWNFVQHGIKLLMIVTPFITILLAGMVFQDVYRISFFGKFYVNPLDGVMLTSSYHVDMGRAMVFHRFHGVVFNVSLAIWITGLIGSILGSALLMQTFKSVRKHHP